MVGPGFDSRLGHFSKGRLDSGTGAENEGSYGIVNAS